MNSARNTNQKKTHFTIHLNMTFPKNLEFTEPVKSYCIMPVKIMHTQDV